MKVHLIKKQSIEEYAIHNSKSRIPFTEWLTKIKYAAWETPLDIVSTFPSADLLGAGSDRIIFDIGGNNYRLIGKYFFGDKQVHLFICWIGTHAEYNKICKESKQYSINIF